MGRARLALAIGTMWMAGLAQPAQRLEEAQKRSHAAVQAMDVQGLWHDALDGLGCVQEAWLQRKADDAPNCIRPQVAKRSSYTPVPNVQ
eukprot:3083809-Alexandrium_andersonii.AAC.1